MNRSIPFAVPYQNGRELDHLRNSIATGLLSGNGQYTRLCEERLEVLTGAKRVLLTASCTHALEMAMLLCDLKAGDEVIIPGFTFVSVANAVALRGAVPVFVDSDLRDLNLDVAGVAAAITRRTKAIIVMHYGGIAADMDALRELADQAGIPLIEDAAHCIGAYYRKRHLGTIGDAGTLSFHASKNIQCGEGGALLINRPDWIERAEQIREKGTNRAQFERGEVGAYTWVTLGSSYLVSELNAAFLYGQLEDVQRVGESRCQHWQRYCNRFCGNPRLTVAEIREEALPNGHLFYVLLPDQKQRDACLQYLRGKGIETAFHYQPLAISPAGIRYGRAADDNTTAIEGAQRLLRLPIYPELASEDVDFIADQLEAFLCSQ